MAQIKRTFTRYRVIGVKNTINGTQIVPETGCETEVLRTHLYQTGANRIVADLLGVTRKPVDVYALYEPIASEVYVIDDDVFLSAATLVTTSDNTDANDGE